MRAKRRPTPTNLREVEDSAVQAYTPCARPFAGRSGWATGFEQDPRPRPTSGSGHVDGRADKKHQPVRNESAHLFGASSSDRLNVAVHLVDAPPDGLPHLCVL